MEARQAIPWRPPEKAFPLRPVVGLAAALATVIAALAVLTGAVPVLVIAAVVGTAAFIVAVLAWPGLATLVVLALIYSNAPVVGAQFHGIPYLVAALVPALLLVPIVDRLVYGGERLVVPPTLPFVLAFLLVATASSIQSRDPAAAATELVRIASEGVLLYLLVVNAARTTSTVRAVVLTLLVVGTGLAALSLLQEVATPGNDFLGFAQIEGRGFDPGTGEEVQGRANGPIGEKNFYAQMLLALVPLAFAAWHAGGRGYRFVAAIAILVIPLGIALTFSRGAAVAAVLLVVAAVALRIISRRTALAIAAVALALVALVPNYAARLGTLAGVGGALEVTADVDPVIAQRANDILAATAAFADHPILGVGPGLFAETYQEYATRVAGLPGDLDYAAHNLYLEVASETGVLGLVAFGGMITVTLVTLLRARRLAAGRGDLLALANGFILVVISYLATGLFLHIAYQRYIWMFLALAMAAAIAILREARAGAHAEAPP